ncbi:MAG: hypothetical protein P4K94_00295 [Terracidiphilus sp.]|nr:hypothetical protein [Terracidiphilus sp.]
MLYIEIRAAEWLFPDWGLREAIFASWSEEEAISHDPGKGKARRFSTAVAVEKLPANPWIIQSKNLSTHIRVAGFFFYCFPVGASTS